MTARHPDHNTQNGEPGTQLVGGEAFKCFEDGLPDVHNASSTTPSRMRMMRCDCAGNIGCMGDDDECGAMFPVEVKQELQNLVT